MQGCGCSSGYCPDCLDCLDCFGGEECAVSGAHHGYYIEGDEPEKMLPAIKLDSLMAVNVVDGVPQCPCCQEPMVRSDGGWMCAMGAAVLDSIYTLNEKEDESPVASPETGGVEDTPGT